MTPYLRTGMSVGLIPRGEVGSVNNEQHEQDNRYDNHQDDHGFSVHQGTFPSAVPPGHRPRRNTAYSGILSFQHEVARRDGSKYARGSTRAICAGKGVRWTPALRLPSAQATGQAVRADRTRASLYDLRNHLAHSRLPDIDESLVRRFTWARLDSLQATMQHHLRTRP